ncbi:unnamed protein product [Ceutorhynchus assimilis]|uniref:Partial AB-hydrolase lipase domain-containing protein n=1 Tax=Ceutorhynchus assimilis TaxID=467358 RepID=A0A9N9MJ08_9CUCU|nr:unnamed protein product [Ceutorhynchus assimilis]
MFLPQVIFLLLYSAIIAVGQNNYDYEAEVGMNTPQIFSHRKIAYKTYQVTTQDGYILSLFQLPRKERRGVVVLQHSLSLDSSVFLVSQKRSIAMEIYNSGYEVWLPNFRGLPLSDQHIKPDIEKLTYWDFSFHEIGLYDFPAILKLIVNVTGEKVIVINHSLSSTASLVYAAVKPQEAEAMVKVFVNMAASAFMNHTQTPFRHFIGLQFNVLKPIMESLNIGAVGYDFLASLQLLKQLALQMLPRRAFKSFIESFLGFLFGKTSMGIDDEEFPLVVSVAVQTVSNKITYHYCQLMQSGRFCMYDYGQQENLKRYNSSQPPDYPLMNITTPIFLVISDSDTMSDAWGSNLLYNNLPQAAKIYGKLNIKNVNHADYLIGKDRFVYFKRVLNFIKTI